MRRCVLFLCTHNSARSQMAEGFLRAMAGDRFEVQSAGTEATRVHPLATRVMAEVNGKIHPKPHIGDPQPPGPHMAIPS